MVFNYAGHIDVTGFVGQDMDLIARKPDFVDLRLCYSISGKGHHSKFQDSYWLL